MQSTQWAGVFSFGYPINCSKKERIAPLYVELDMVAGGAKTNGEILTEGVSGAIEKNKPIIDAVADGASKVRDILKCIYNK